MNVFINANVREYGCKNRCIREYGRSSVLYTTSDDVTDERTTMTQTVSLTDGTKQNCREGVTCPLWCRARPPRDPSRPPKILYRANNFFPFHWTRAIQASPLGDVNYPLSSLVCVPGGAWLCVMPAACRTVLPLVFNKDL